MTSHAGPPQQVFCVLNPVSRGSREAGVAVRRACADARWPAPVVLETTLAEPGGAQARAALAAGADVVVVGGGDGTVREVAHVLAGTDTDLGILPLGTANLVAHNLGLRTRRLRRSVASALHAPSRPIDVGRAAWRPVVGGRTGALVGERTFLVMAGLGNDAATVLAVRPEFKRRFGWLAYLLAGLRHLGSRPLTLRLSVDGTPARQVRTWTLLVANFGRLPSGLRVFPDARADDGILDTLVVPLAHVLQWGPVALTGLGLRRRASALRYGQARQVWAIPARPAPLQLDGDVVESVTDVHITVLPGALRVRAPRPER